MGRLNYLKLEIEILGSLFRQWNGFEDFNILNFGKILLKFAIVIFGYFCPFSIITGQRSFQVMQMSYMTWMQRQKNSFEHFHCEIWKFF